MDDSEAVVREVERVSLSLWGAIASTRRESGESEEAWRERRRKAYRELAPLLDRVGRLSVDVASLLEFEGNGGEIERVALETSVFWVLVPTKVKSPWVTLSGAPLTAVFP